MKNLDKFERDIISGFWKWIKAHEVDVEWREANGKEQLLMWVEAEDIRSFGEEFCIQDDTFLECTLVNIDTFCINVADILDGHGFKMEDVLPKEKIDAKSL